MDIKQRVLIYTHVQIGDKLKESQYSSVKVPVCCQNFTEWNTFPVKSTRCFDDDSSWEHYLQ